MKKLMILGGLVGFAIGSGLGVAVRGASSPSTILRAALAAAAGGLLMRWWGTVWVNSVREASLERAAHLRQPSVKDADSPLRKK